MSPSRFIARKLRFQGNIAAVSIAVSFLVIILAVSISSGFRSEIRKGIAAMTGDIRISSAGASLNSEEDPVPAVLPSEAAIRALPGVKDIAPAIYRAGIVRSGDAIHGVLLKGIPSLADSALCVSVPRRLSTLLSLREGDELTTYFVGEKVRVRKFRVAHIHDDILEMDDNLVVYARIEDLRRLNGWQEDEASAVEVSLDPRLYAAGLVQEYAFRIGEMLYQSEDPDESSLVSLSSVNRYPQLFDWLDLLDFNVLVLLILMVVVAGFNMISGLLIMLLRHISTIGVLKTMGMSDAAIGKVFLRVAAGVVFRGMLAGNALGLLFCVVQDRTHLLPLDPVNYFVSFVPVHIDWGWILAADAVAFAAIMLLVMIPTLLIARVDPAETVKAQ